MAQYVDFPLSEDHEMIRSAVREFVSGEVAPRAREFDESAAFPAEVLGEYAENGMLGIPFPEALGGGDGDALGFLLSVREVARACASTAVTIAEHVAFTAWPIFRLGTEAQKASWLEPMLAGESLGSLAHNERRVGEVLPYLRARLATAGDGMRLTGEKTFVINAGRPGPMLVSAHPEASAAPSGESVHLLLVPKDAAGVSLGERLDTMGARACDVRDVALREVELAREAWLGERPIAAAELDEVFALGQAALVAVALGLIDSAMAQ